VRADGPESIVGTPGNHVIVALGGDDQIGFDLDFQPLPGSDAGRNDIICASDGIGILSQPSAVGSGPHSVAVGDLDGDGHSDLATANDADDNVSVLLAAGLEAAPEK
jgi:hypothetical protein